MIHIPNARSLAADALAPNNMLENANREKEEKEMQLILPKMSNIRIQPTTSFSVNSSSFTSRKSAA